MNIQWSVFLGNFVVVFFLSFELTLSAVVSEKKNSRRLCAAAAQHVKLNIALVGINGSLCL